MWTVSRVVCMGILAGLSVIDIRTRRIPIWGLAVWSASVFCYQLFRILGGDGDILTVVGGAGIGVLFLFVSRVTREGIGYGDSWAVLILGGYLGMWGLIETLAGVFILLALCSVICMAVKRMSREVRLPFFPFLAAGYLLYCFAC